MVIDTMSSPAAPASRVWFITGCSTGFGLELARLIIGRGWRAVVTARDRAKVADLARGAEDRVLALSLDVTEAGQIRESVRAATDTFGRIDVLVNNAGLIHSAPLVSLAGGDKAES